jgi:hypothetical protein
MPDADELNAPISVDEAVHAINYCCQDCDGAGYTVYHAATTDVDADGGSFAVELVRAIHGSTGNPQKFRVTVESLAEDATA